MYIAHISEDGKRKQTVHQHNVETAEIARTIGKNRGLEYTGYLAGLLHDIGKAERFDSYIHRCYDESQNYRKIQKPGDHSTAGGKYIYERYRNGSKMEQLTAILIAEAIMSHHGLDDIVNEEGKCKFKNRIYKSEEIEYEHVLDELKVNYPELDNLDTYMQLAVKEISELIQKIQVKAKRLIENQTKITEKIDECRMFEVGLLERMILSLVIEADRISTYEFMQNRSHQQILIEDDCWDKLCYSFETYITTFKNNTKLAPLRQQISNECKDFALMPCGIYKLPCPTGSGKTLAGMRFALHHAKFHNSERIIYVAPFRSILDQNAIAIKKSMGRDDIVLEHHSNVIPEDEVKYACMTDDYSNRIVLTTMVQFLNTLLGGKTQCIRRFHSFCNSVIIIDEVQSLPIKVVNLFNSIMNFFTSYFNTTVVLCTATMPLLDQVNRPIQISPPGNMITNISEQFEAFRRVEVNYISPEKKYSNKELRDYIDENLTVADSILVILNTKAAAEGVYRECEELAGIHSETKYTIVLLTTNLCPAHRISILKDITEKLNNKNGKLICISTQLIEAGVDLSFDVVIRSLAGLDSIAQAAGRCNRNMEKPVGYVYIVNSAEENLTHLPDIREGQIATKLVWQEYIKEPGRFNFNILSPKAMELFYEQYYFRRKNEMDYVLMKKPSIFKLLSNNAEWVNRYIDSNMDDKDFFNVVRYLPQAFHEAGNSFEVIDSDTIGVLVPYGKGKKIIAELNTDIEFDEMRQLLREAQLYTVNMYTATQHRLIEENAIYELKKGGILAVNEGFYSEEYGLTVTKALEGLFI